MISLIAKIIVGSSCVAAGATATTLGIVYQEQVKEFFGIKKAQEDFGANSNTGSGGGEVIEKSGSGTQNALEKDGLPESGEQAIPLTDGNGQKAASKVSEEGEEGGDAQVEGPISVGGSQTPTPEGAGEGSEAMGSKTDVGVSDKISITISETPADNKTTVVIAADPGTDVQVSSLGNVISEQ